MSLDIEDDIALMNARLEAFEGSVSLEVGAIMGLFRPENIDALMAAMPEAARGRFVAWCKRLRDGGEPLGVWEANFARGFQVVCAWIARGGEPTDQEGSSAMVATTRRPNSVSR